MEKWNIELHTGASHTIGIYDGQGFWFAMRLVLCFECRVLGATQGECRHFPSLVHWRCAGPTALVSVLLILMSICLRRMSCIRRRGGQVLRLPGIRSVMGKVTSQAGALGLKQRKPEC